MTESRIFPLSLPVLAALFLLDANCRAQDDLRTEIKKVVGRNWKSIEPCIDIFAAGHGDAKYFVIRFEVEPGEKIGEVLTQPFDEQASDCFKAALSSMSLPAVEEEVSLQFKIDLPEKRGPEKEFSRTQEEEPAGKKPARKRPPDEVPVGRGKMYIVGGKIMGSVKLKSFLVKQEVSRIPARKSRANTIAGWSMQIFGSFLNISGIFLLTFGLNAMINEFDVSWHTPFVISGASMLVVGIVFDTVGSILIPRGWSYLGAAVRAYNSSNPDEPVFPAGY